MNNNFLYPKKFTYQKIPSCCERDVYLFKNKNNILAEFWMLLQESSPDIFEVTTQINAETNTVDEITSVVEQGHDAHTAAAALKAHVGRADEKKPELKDFHKHFGVLNGKYCLLIYKAGNLCVSEGESRGSGTGRRGDGGGAAAEPPRVAWLDYGFIGDFINELEACISMAKPGFIADDMLSIVADPRKRRAAGFLRASDRDLRLPGIAPANAGQGQAIQGLRRSIEGIQGPPGTGKSTVIAHILRSSIPPDELSLVTCVQNKAVDAIAEKLCSIGKGILPFIVIGNVDRVGLTAMQWTLDAQAKRDARVVPIALRLSHFSTSAAQVTAFIQGRLALLDVEYLSRQREALALLKFKPEERMTDAASLAFKAWLHVEPWVRVWRAYIQDKYKIKLAYLDCLTLRAAALAEQLGAMHTLVCGELMSSCRAVLCTTAAAASTLPRQEFAAMLSRMHTIIIDEAGTVPDTKLPLLVSLSSSGIRQIVAIGDQQQLAPFTRLGGTGGRGGTSESPLGFFQRVEQALRPGGVRSLSEQFRMHPTVCEFVAKTFYQNKLTTNGIICSRRLSADPIGLWWISYGDGDRDGDSGDQDTDPRTHTHTLLEGAGCAESVCESTPARSHSKANEAEATLALSLLGRPDMKGKSVMVIAFYKEQVRLLKRKLRRLGSCGGWAERRAPRSASCRWTSPRARRRMWSYSAACGAMPRGKSGLFLMLTA
jgi:hypothetical protein